MKKSINILFSLCLLWLNPLCGQDLHFTNYRNISNFFNPSQTGKFEGSIKIQAATRSQYDGTYQQAVFGGQYIFKSPFAAQHWIGLGMDILYDKAGSLALNAKGGGISAGYHAFMDKKKTSVLSAGFSIKQVSLGINTDQYLSENKILGTNDPDLMKLNSFKPNLNTMGFGVQYSKTISKLHSFHTGLAINHLNRPKFSLLGTSSQAFYGNRFNFNFNWKATVHPSVAIEPATYISFSESQSNINLQLMSEWKLKKNASWRAIAGASTRLGESIDFIAGYSGKKLTVTASYDLLTNALANPLNGFGAIELGAFYIFTLHETPKVKPIVICPRL